MTPLDAGIISSANGRFDRTCRLANHDAITFDFYNKELYAQRLVSCAPSNPVTPGCWSDRQNQAGSLPTAWSCSLFVLFLTPPVRSGASSYLKEMP
jgi:hypothetical protein